MKNGILGIAIVMLILLSLSSCISTKNYANRVSTWKGHDVNNLITSWGPPSDVYTMPNGNKMYTWLKSSDGTVTKRYNEFSKQIVERKNVSYCKTTFTANDEDIIINWRIQGDLCISFK